MQNQQAKQFQDQVICGTMTSHLPSSDHVDSAAADHPPPPPARWQHDDNSDSTPRIRLMCSFGGRVLPRPHDNQLRYVGGDTRIVAIPRNSTYSTLLSKLTKFTATADVTIKYQLPNEDLDALISVTSDEDIENMMEEYHRLLPHSRNSTNNVARTPRLRMFLFPSDGGNNSGGSSSGGFGSILSGSGASKHENWFLDALNGRTLERNRSEASSIVSEVPDYLFGLDNNSDDQPVKSKTNVSISDPGSPAPIVSSPHYGSASSAQYVPIEINNPVGPDVNLNSYPNPNPVWQYVDEQVPVYYVPGPAQGVRLPVQLPMQYAQTQYRPVYVGGPPQMGRPAMSGAYDYVVGPTAVGPESNIPIYRPTMGAYPGIGELPASKGSQ